MKKRPGFLGQLNSITIANNGVQTQDLSSNTQHPNQLTILRIS